MKLDILFEYHMLHDAFLPSFEDSHEVNAHCLGDAAIGQGVRAKVSQITSFIRCEHFTHILPLLLVLTLHYLIHMFLEFNYPSADSYSWGSWRQRIWFQIRLMAQEFWANY